MSDHRAEFAVKRMCCTLGVSTSGYYAWRTREPSARACADEALQNRIVEIHAGSRGTYGVPRIHAELAADGVRTGRKRVSRLMRRAGIEGISRRRGTWTTKRDRDVRPAPDLVERDFATEGPDRLWVAALYAAQGLPFGLFAVAIPAWLAAQGASAAEIGSYLAIATLPWSAKLLAGPLMDRFTFLPMGRRRPWVLGAQLGIGALFLATVPDPGQLFLITTAGFTINAFAALQDVAVDGMAIDVLPENERARANAFMFGGQAVGASGSASVGTYVFTHWGLPAVALLMLLAVAAIMLVPILFRERAEERLLPWSPGRASQHAEAMQVHEWGPIIKDLLCALFLPMSILLVTVEFLQRASSGILGVVMPLVTVAELGWVTTTYGNWVAAAGLIAALVGVLVGPFVDQSTGRARLLGSPSRERCSSSVPSRY